MYEWLITIFNVFVGIVSGEIIAIAAASAIGLLVFWALFSLLFSAESRFSKACRKISILLDEKGLTSETYPKFIELASHLPKSFLIGWQTFEHSKTGLPSQFITRYECLESELNGGLFKKNRSVMKGFIAFFTAIFAILSFAILDTTEALTGYMLAEALFIPFMFVLLGFLIYFLYAALRQYQYRICVDDFGEMMEILNNKVENNEIEVDERDNEPSSFVQNVVDPSSFGREPIVIVNPQNGKSEADESDSDVSPNFGFAESDVVSDEPYEEIKDDDLPIHDAFLVDDHSTVVGEDASETNNENKSSLEEIPVEKQDGVVYNENISVKQTQEKPQEKRGRGRPRKEKVDDGEIVIRTDEEFEQVLKRAEKLMRKNDEPLSTSQQKRVEKALKALVDAMKKYKGEN